MIRRALFAVFALVFLANAAEAAAPVRRALLVGVQEYNGIAGVSLFDGPRNSVLLWHDYLRKQGFTDIAVLAEGMNADVKWGKTDPKVGNPTRANIQAAFADLEKKLEKSGGKDIVLIVLAGHGSQQRAMPWDPPKPNNLDEVFLPADAGPRPDGDPEGPYKNALVDHDIAPHLKKMAKHAAFLWLVFDSCHSDTMTYDALLLKKKPQRNNLSYGTVSAPQPPARPAMGPSPKDRDWPTNYVALFASASDQTTPLVVNDAGPIAARIGDGPVRFTAFSYFMLEALRKNPAITFNAIVASVAASYRSAFPADSYEPKSEGGARLALPATTALAGRR